VTKRDLEHISVLIVDTDWTTALGLASMAHAIDIRNCERALYGADALKALRHFPADVIICGKDVRFPGAPEFIRSVRTGRASTNRFVPIILLTENAPQKAKDSALEAGVTEFLEGDITPERLYEHIRMVIEAPRPFVKSGLFFGPDRRRRQLSFLGAVDRRAGESLHIR